MALINRLSRLFRADFHAVLDQIEEPEALLKQAIRDMEDDLANTEQRIKLCAHDQDALSRRKDELENSIAETDAQLDLCFESEKDDLAKGLIRKKLEAERLLKQAACEARSKCPLPDRATRLAGRERCNAREPQAKSRVVRTARIGSGGQQLGV